MTIQVGTQFHGTWAELTDSDRAKILDSMVDAGVTWVRIDMAWSMLQPKAGEYDMKWGVPFVDGVIDMAHQRGLKILATFWRTPQWASVNPGSPDKNVFPKSRVDFAKAIQFAAERYKGKVQAWEIWNEPNAKEFLSPVDAVKYTELLRAAYVGVKAGNPDALVVFGGPMFVDTDWIEKCYAAGAKNCFDVMAVHPYQGNAAKSPTDPDQGKRERLLHTDVLVDLMSKNRDSKKPIWFTEFGWSTHDNTPTTEVWFLGVSEATQAAFLTLTLATVSERYPQVTHVFWYTSRDLVTGRIHQDHRGLLRKDFTAKPALESIRVFVAKDSIVEIRAADYSRAPEDSTV